MAAIISKSEVISLAFEGGFSDTDLLQQSVLNIAEFKYIRDALGENLYKYIIDNQGSYSDFITNYWKPCAAYWVKYLSVDSIWMQLTNRGIGTMITENANSVTSSDKTNFATKQNEIAELYTEKMVDYVKDQKYIQNNSDYDLYGDQTNVLPENKMPGGWNLKTKVKRTKIEDQ
jgi:hypothetical protein